MEAEGFSRGIWLLWSRDDLTVNVLEQKEQFIHCRLSLSGVEVLFSAFYASPCEQKRRGLWEDFQDIANSVTEPWFIAGDFNEIKTPLEQKGGGRVSETRCKRFNEWIQECGLIDIEAKGPFYTWKGPKWDGLDRVYKRLDRCLCNIQWIEKFENAEVQVSPRLCSDHHPLLIKLEADNQMHRKRSFRYEAMWQTHENFEEVMRQGWRGNEEAHVKLATLQHDLTKWNKEVFGHIAGRKRRLLNRLNGIQCSMERNNNPFLINLEAELEDELLNSGWINGLREEEDWGRCALDLYQRMMG
ncbi:hypothetical protein K1719_035062 [Acacia pycnantha]|nr:hypothetical protein K1719_035062 [Acacia pycnantha]